MPIVVDHSGNPIFGAIDAAAGGAGAFLQGRQAGMGDFNQMLLQLARAQMVERSQAQAFARDKEMAEFQSRLAVDRSKIISDRERADRKADAKEDRDRETEEALGLAIGIGGEYNQPPPVGMRTRDDVYRWAAGLRIDKHRAEDDAQQEKMYGKRRADVKADEAESRRLEEEAVGRVGPQLIPGYELMQQRPKTFDELRAAYGAQQEYQRRSDDKEKVKRDESHRKTMEGRLRHQATVEQLSRAASAVDDQIRRAIEEMKALNLDTAMGWVDPKVIQRSNELSQVINTLRKRGNDIALAIQNMPPPTGRGRGRRGGRRFPDSPACRPGHE